MQHVNDMEFMTRQARIDLTHLLETTSFEDLSVSEREAVLAMVSEQTYRRMRRAHLLADGHFKQDTLSLAPDPALLPRLKQQVRSKRSLNGLAPTWWTASQRHFPVYQAAAAAAVLAFALHFWGSSIQQEHEAGRGSAVFADSTSSHAQTSITQDEDTVRDDSLLKYN